MTTDRTPAPGTLPSVPLAEARAQLSKLVTLAEYTGQVTALTRYGQPVAAIVPARLLPLLAGAAAGPAPIDPAFSAAVQAHAATITGTSHEENAEILDELRRDDDPAQ
ncbi:type II toxin-antitoxin system Phd/YefM family antitoxin [Streptomyces sp. PKU-MA01144]|uniref:type II toxin-antitoxin system Phd/YefM family antitoxin n=1 Tax=Streptomyces TaxID=1883 RepID=UPI00147BDBC4|nr:MULTISPECIES: type II toxin-antitoxin system prevent-host-death family antitoxin [Streptomyces]MCY0980066.1 type II toxin-antitoxin system prevent-host-death family antitoxin [Streptomyces tirandamycinicus]NNJ03988.1 type II toxin-antitoxin system Phd/YefM family antitoxin [Streptomyces sp. PKU-MA01144]